MTQWAQSSIEQRFTMRIVHLSTSDTGGGAARAAYRLHTGLRRLGHDSQMVVARKLGNDLSVHPFTPRSNPVHRLGHKLRARRIYWEYEAYRPIPSGHEPFSDDRTPYAGELAWQIPPADVINLHWVAGLLDHENFFPRIPRRIPIVWRLADMAALTGGCHYDAGCDRFTQRCGSCPQLGSSDDDDLSRQIWHRKKHALGSRAQALHFVGTSNWIAGQARRSSLLGEFPITVIPNGLDTDDFAPRDKNFSRDLWDIPRDARVALFAAESVANVRKGFRHLADAVAGIDNLLLVSVGGGKCELPPGVRHKPLGRINNDRMLSTIYSAADVFVIPSLQESFGQTVIESLACGLPVIGFASGGIPDMVRPGQTGWLAPTGDTAALRDAIAAAVLDDATRSEMAKNCRRVALEEYSIEVQARHYAELYQTLLRRADAAAPSVEFAAARSTQVVG